jgi:DNA-binding transcriptional ArsR family regulator
MNLLKTSVPVEIKAKMQAEFCQVFSNPIRVLILWSLMQQEMSVGDIAEEVDSSIQNVSQHLRRMKEYHLVRSRRDGQTIYYRIDREILEKHCASLLALNAVSTAKEDVDFSST